MMGYFLWRVEEKKSLSSEKVGKFKLQSGNSHDLLDRAGFLGTRGALTVD
jgi:hypothetical protein